LTILRDRHYCTQYTQRGQNKAKKNNNTENLKDEQHEPHLKAGTPEGQETSFYSCTHAVTTLTKTKNKKLVINPYCQANSPETLQ